MREHEETCSRNAREESREKKDDNFNNTRKRKFSGCNLINNAKRRLGGGEIGPREQISQHSWGKDSVRQGIKGSQHRLSPPRLRKLKLKFGILSYELQKCLPLLGYFFSFNFTHSVLYFSQRTWKRYLCVRNSLVKVSY